MYYRGQSLVPGVGARSGSGVAVGEAVAVGSGRRVALGDGSGGRGVGVDRLLPPARGASRTRIVLTAIMTPKTRRVRCVPLARWGGRLDRFNRFAIE